MPNIYRFIFVLLSVVLFFPSYPALALQPASREQAIRQVLDTASIRTEPGIRWHAIEAMEELVTSGTPEALDPKVLLTFLQETQDLHLRLYTLGGQVSLEAGTPFRFLQRAIESDPALARNPEILAFVEAHRRAIERFALAGENRNRYGEDLEEARRWHGYLEKAIRKATSLESFPAGD